MLYGLDNIVVSLKYHDVIVYRYMNMAQCEYGIVKNDHYHDHVETN